MDCVDNSVVDSLLCMIGEYEGEDGSAQVDSIKEEVISPPVPAVPSNRTYKRKRSSPIKFYGALKPKIKSEEIDVESTDPSSIGIVTRSMDSSTNDIFQETLRLVNTDSHEDGNIDVLEKLYNQLEENLENEETDQKMDTSTNRCLVCNAVFTDSTTLRLHCAFYHTQNNDSAMGVLWCWKCRKPYVSTDDYIYHKREIHPNDPFVCIICGIMVASEISLGRHLNSHAHPNGPTISYECNVCKKSFKSKTSLRGHVNAKHLIGSAKEHICNICGSMFTQKKSVTRHIRLIHMGEKPECTLCGKVMSSGSALYHHQRTIHQNVAFHCGYCSKVFKSVSAVKKHETLMHQEFKGTRDSRTHRHYSYNQYVTTQCKSGSRNNPVNEIRCMFCKAAYRSHADYRAHYHKFHRNEIRQVSVDAEVIGGLLDDEQERCRGTGKISEPRGSGSSVETPLADVFGATPHG